MRVLVRNVLCEPDTDLFGEHPDGQLIHGTRGRVEWVSGSGGAGYGLLNSAQPALEVHGAMHARLNIGTQLGSGILWARCSGALATFTGYGIRLGRSATGGLNAELVRGPQDAPVIIATMAGSPTWPDYTTYYRAELEVTGSNPTTIRGRWFPAGSPPADDDGWTTVTDSTGPQAAGVYGFRGQRTGSVATEYYIDTIWMAEPLRPAFTATPGVDGLTVAFVSSVLTSGDVAAHGWTFGDGTDAVVADPTKVSRPRAPTACRTRPGPSGARGAPSPSPCSWPCPRCPRTSARWCTSTGRTSATACTP